jgi:hypothetical protein
LCSRKFVFSSFRALLSLSLSFFPSFSLLFLSSSSVLAFYSIDAALSTKQHNQTSRSYFSAATAGMLLQVTHRERERQRDYTRDRYSGSDRKMGEIISKRMEAI